MFTGIVQGTAVVERITDQPGLRQLVLQFAEGFTRGLEVGASVSVDGVCLTVTSVSSPELASFDVIQETLSLTTLGALVRGSRVNVERAAKEGSEIGGHLISGHIDFRATVVEVRTPDNNHVLRLSVPAPWMRYVFRKGYIAINGASLTVSAAERAAGWFEVSLIPETLRVTTFSEKAVSDAVNIEIERATQVVVDTVRDAVEERLGPLLPALERLLGERGLELAELAALQPAPKPPPR
jgi:riboflavin synthase